MPSWNDGDSSPEPVEHFTALDYAPDTVEDPTFFGPAVDCRHVCRVHKLQPVKRVAFGGVDTGRKFYMCPIENQVERCGFVHWVDEEWPDTLKNAICKLWGMYEESESLRLDERIQSASLVEELSAEKDKLEKELKICNAEANKFFLDTHKKVMAANCKRIMEDTEGQLKDEVADLKKRVDELSNEVGMLKSQADVMKTRLSILDAEKETLKEEKKKLEYNIFDLFKASEANKENLKASEANEEKLKKILAILNE